jgi:NADPH:quinone reductase-like Zn-dependent oxidoreductase
MTGQPYLMRLLGFGLRAPSLPVPGTNFAGVVEAVGRGVDAFVPGDEVHGASRGTFAQHVVAPVRKLAPQTATAVL